MPSVQLQVRCHKQRRWHRQALGRENWWEISQHVCFWTTNTCGKKIYIDFICRRLHPWPSGTWVWRLRRCRLEDSLVTNQAGEDPSIVIIHYAKLETYFYWSYIFQVLNKGLCQSCHVHTCLTVSSPGLCRWVAERYRGDQADGFGLRRWSQVIKIHAEQGQSNPLLSLKRILKPLQEIFLVWNGCRLGARDLYQNVSYLVFHWFVAQIICYKIIFISCSNSHSFCQSHRWPLGYQPFVFVFPNWKVVLEKISCNFTIYNEEISPKQRRPYLPVA